MSIHGWPTSSFDWAGAASELSDRFRVCALDFPGYGFSDKPQGWGYGLARDEELIEFYVAEVIGAEGRAIVGHDPVPVTMIWGLYDTVSPPRVASYVWNEYTSQ